MNTLSRAAAWLFAIADVLLGIFAVGFFIWVLAAGATYLYEEISGKKRTVKRFIDRPAAA